MVQQPIQHRGCQGGIAGKRVGPLAERQVRGQDHRPFLIALRHHLKEQVRFLASERQVADLIDHQQPWTEDGAVEVFLQPPLSLRRAQLQHQVGCRDEACLDPGLRGLVTQGDGEVGLADARGSDQHHVLGPFDKRQTAQLLHQCLGHAGVEAEVIVLQGLDAREASHPRQQFAAALLATPRFMPQQVFRGSR